MSLSSSRLHAHSLCNHHISYATQYESPETQDGEKTKTPALPVSIFLPFLAQLPAELQGKLSEGAIYHQLFEI